MWEVPSGALKLFTKVLGFARDGMADKAGHAHLSELRAKREETFFLRLDRTKAEREALWRFLEGPNPEFRDPTRFALLEAFPDANSYTALADLLKAVVPFRLDDLEQEKFKQEIAPTRSMRSHSYVELADRVGGMETLLRKAIAIVPNSRKLKAVFASLEKWRISAQETVLTT